MATDMAPGRRLPPGTYIPKPAEFHCPCGRALYVQCTDQLWRCSRCACAYESAAFEDRAPAVKP